jgi:hypothetical protein
MPTYRCEEDVIVLKKIVAKFGVSLLQLCRDRALLVGYYRVTC